MRRAPLVTLIAVLTLALTGCTDESGPSGLPSDAATPPATTATPSSAPRIPPIAPATVNEQTDEGAKAAATFFIQALEYLFNSGDASAIQEASVPDCQSCQKVQSSVASLYNSGGHMTTGEYVVSNASIQEDISPVSKIVDLHGTRPIHQQFDSTGAQIKVEPEQPLPISCLMLWNGERWLVDEYEDAA